MTLDDTIKNLLNDERFHELGEADLSEEAIQYGFRHYFTQGRISSLRRLKELTGSELSQSVREEGYHTYLAKGWLDAVKAVKPIAGDIPKSPRIDTAVQELYLAQDTKDIKAFKKVGRITGIKANEAVIQKKYDTCVTNNWLDTFKEYEKHTKVTPVVAEETIQQRYRDDLADRRSIDHLLDRFDTRPDARAAASGYTYALDKMDSDWRDYVRSVSGAEVPQEIIDISAESHIAKQGMGAIAQIKELLGATPSQEAIERGFRAVNEQYFSSPALSQGIELIKEIDQKNIMPERKYLGERYEQVMRTVDQGFDHILHGGVYQQFARRFKLIRNLMDKDIRPTEQWIDNAYLHLATLDEKEFWRFYEAMPKPSEDVVRELYSIRPDTPFMRRLRDETEVQPL